MRTHFCRVVLLIQNHRAGFLFPFSLNTLSCLCFNSHELLLWPLVANGSSVGTAVHWVTLIFLLCRGPRQRPAISKWKWATLCVRQTEPKQEFYLVRKKAVKIKPREGTINCWSLSHVSRHCPSLLRKVTEPCCFAFSEPLRRGFQIILPHPLPHVRTR